MANYHRILTLEKVVLNYHGNLPRYCFITLAPGRIGHRNLDTLHEILVLRTDERISCVRCVDVEPGAELLADGPCVKVTKN
jgi:hypothetical protein